MADRLAGFVVTFRAPLRADDAAAVESALRLLAPVATVTPVVADLAHSMAVELARWQMRQKLFEALADFGKESQ